MKVDVDLDELNEQQLDVFMKVMRDLVTLDERVVVVSGSAGVGKTFMMAKLVRALSKISTTDVPCLTLTGKAAHQLTKKGVPATTFHSTIYNIKEDRNGEIYFELKDPSEFAYEYVCIDESSMVPEEIVDFLLRTNTKMVMFGDHKQLPPVNSEYNIAEDFDYEMTEVVRTKKDDPIVKLAYEAYNNNRIPKSFDEYDNIKIFGKDVGLGRILRENDYDAVICGTNNRRKQLNQTIRQLKGYEFELPEPGEPIMCLKNQYLDDGTTLYNGVIYRVVDRMHSLGLSTFYRIYDEWRDATVVVMIEDDYFHADLSRPKNPMKSGKSKNASAFTFGWASTCHKQQGDEHDKVLFVDEDVSYFLEQKRFRYTAITRAKKELHVKLT